MCVAVSVPLQDFIAIILMLSYLREGKVMRIGGAEFTEFFSGRARTARMANARGFKTKALDYIYAKSFDLLRPSGLMLLGRFFRFTMRSGSEFGLGHDPLQRSGHDLPDCDRVLHVCAHECWHIETDGVDA